MADKKTGLKKLFSKPNKDCCSIEIEEVKSTENNCCGSSEKNSEAPRNEA